jgi:hypothetical protein
LSHLLIISGGQTGVDRGALDAALAAGAPCGGYCPAGRRAEDGRIPNRYPLTETAGSAYRERTLRNVSTADGTLILCPGPPEGGTALTLAACRALSRPCLVVDTATAPARGAAERAAGFVAAGRFRCLNVAGPRASEWPGGRRYAFIVVSELLRRPPVSP